MFTSPENWRRSLCWIETQGQVTEVRCLQIFVLMSDLYRSMVLFLRNFPSKIFSTFWYRPHVYIYRESTFVLKKVTEDGGQQATLLCHRDNGNIPHWCRKPSPVVTSSTSRTNTASMAALPFHVSALFVQPHSQTTTGGGSSLRCESYAANSSSTLPRGTKDCRTQIPKTF